MPRGFQPCADGSGRGSRPFCRLQVWTSSSLNQLTAEAFDACCVFGLIRISYRRFLRATMRFHGNMARRLNRHNSSADVKGLFQPTVRWLFQLIDANDTGEDMHCFRRANNRSPSNGVLLRYIEVVFFFFDRTNLLSRYKRLCNQIINADTGCYARTSFSFNECETVYKLNYFRQPRRISGLLTSFQRHE